MERKWAYFFTAIFVDLCQVLEDSVRGMLDAFATFPYGSELVCISTLGTSCTIWLCRPRFSRSDWRGCQCLDIVPFKPFWVLDHGRHQRKIVGGQNLNKPRCIV